MHFLHMAWLEFKGQRAAFHFEEFLLLDTLYPFLTLVFYCVMAGYAYETTNVTDWVIGNAFLLCTNICVFALGTSFVGERQYGRLRSIMVAKTSKIEIVMQKGFFSIGTSLLTTFVGFGAGCMVFGISWKNILWEGVLVILVGAMFAAVGFGMFLSVLGLLSHQMHLILNVIQYVLLIFTGANFPVEQLPEAAQIVSYVLPLTRSMQAARILMGGNGIGISDITKLMLAEVFVGIAYLLMAAGIVKIAEKIAIKSAKLELF